MPFPAAAVLQQEPRPEAVHDSASAPDGFWSWLLDLGREPGVVEILLAATILAVAVVVWWRFARLIEAAQSRDALRDYLLGVEQALHGDCDGAYERLTRVLQKDPANLYARLLLGKVLAQRGESEQAHQQHLSLQRAFGLSSGENDLLLAESLLACGMPGEAADVVDGVLGRQPRLAAAWRLAYRARLQGGDVEGAVRAGSKLLDLTPERAAREQLRADVAAAVAQAGSLRWAAGDRASAARAAQQAKLLAPGAPGLSLLDARIEAGERGLPATVQRLLAAAPPPPPTTGGALVAAAHAASAEPAGLPVATFEGLVPTARWSCKACGQPHARQLPQCPRCLVADPSRQEEPQLVRTIEAPLEVMDGIDANDEHVQRLVAAATAEGAGAAKARAALVELGERAVLPLLRSAWRRSEADQDVVVDVLAAMGPGTVPALFAAADRVGRDRLLPLGERSPAGLVGRVVQRFDRSALVHIDLVQASQRPEHRKIVIDFYVGLADLVLFQHVLERFPPLEILARLNHAEPLALRRFLRAVPAGHFVAEALLVEPTFYRDQDVLEASAGAPNAEVLHGVLLRRGPTRTLTKALIQATADDALRDDAARLLEQLGRSVIEHVLVAYADAEGGTGDRDVLAAVLVRGGAAAARQIVNSFGAAPTALDDDLRSLLVRIGQPAVDALVAAYEQSGWFERMAASLLSRHTNRRVQIVLALGAIDGSETEQALAAMLERERDANLRLCLSRELHRRRGGAPGEAP
jgi:tetratricopeptide (TPR) repeat protein